MFSKRKKINSLETLCKVKIAQYGLLGWRHSSIVLNPHLPASIFHNCRDIRELSAWQHYHLLHHNFTIDEVFLVNNFRAFSGVCYL